MRPAALTAAALLLCAAAPVADPDWPCVQRLVPTLSAGSLWAGPPPAADWKSDAAVVALVEEAAPRDVPAEDAAGKLAAFAGAHAPEQAAEAFAGLVDRVNAQRSDVIAHLREIGRRQRELADRASRSTAEEHALPDDAPAGQRQEVVDRRALLIREYQSIDRTLQYACDVPVQLERRLGRFAQALQQAPP